MRLYLGSVAARGVKVSRFAAWPFFMSLCTGHHFQKTCTRESRIVRTRCGGERNAHRRLALSRQSG
jgi:hypothetical protein